nr:hypothetical protein [Mesorhizobium sp.]
MADKYKIEEWRHPNGEVWFRLKALTGRWPFRLWDSHGSFRTVAEAEGMIRSGLIKDPVNVSTRWYDSRGHQEHWW